MKSTKTTYLVRIALLMAIPIVLAATPLGYIPAGVLSFTIMVLPVAIGGVLMGTPAGLIRSYLWCNEFYQSPYGGSGAVDLEL